MAPENRPTLGIPLLLLVLLPYLAIAAPFKVVSLLETCESTNQIDETALAVHYGIMHGLNENFVEGTDFEYEFYDVCNQTNKMVEILLKVIVDVSYKKQEPIGNGSVATPSNTITIEANQILCVMLYLSKDRTILAANILSSALVPVISFQNYSLQNRVYNERFLEHGELKKETNDYLLNLLQRHHYDYLIVFSLNQSYEINQRYQNFVQMARNKICMVYESTDVQDAVARSLTINNTRAHAFVIFGGLWESILFPSLLKKNLSDDSFPLLYPVFEEEHNGPMHFNATNKLVNLLKEKNIAQHHSITDGKYNQSHVLINFDVYFNTIKDYWKLDLLSTSDVLDTFKSQKYINRSGQSSCTNFTCGPGFERKLVKAPNTQWQNRYVYQCFQCEHNHVKGVESEGNCQPCINKNISNFDRTHCYVLYRLRSFDFQSPGSLVGLALNLVGLLFSILTIFLFELYKKTPIVRASDRTLSQIQTTSSFLLFLFLLVQALLQVTTVSCVLLPSSIGVTFSTLVAITVAKVEKPLLVFRQRKQLTQKDINATIAHQYFMIILIPLTSIMLAFVQFKYNPISIKTSYNDTTLEKSVMCSSDGHLHIQIIFIILLSLFTLIQAYRSRKLPDNYSESMTILYSSFSAAVFLAILFPLYHFQPTGEARLNVQWILISSVALILMVSLYTHKLYVMVFHPEKNTMKAWNRRRVQYSMEDSTSYYTVPMTTVDTHSYSSV
eukprot:TCONS_00024229-protein